MAPLSERIGGISMALYNLELLILLVANVSCLLFLQVLRRTKCFHLNLRLLLANFSFTFILVIVSRYLIIAPLWMAYAFDIDVGGIPYCRFAKTLHDTAIYVTGLGLAVLVIERTVATLFVRIYETTERRSVGMALLVLQWVFGLLFVLANQIDAADQRTEKLACQMEYTSHRALLISLLTIIAMDAIAMLVFLALLKINQQNYRSRARQATHPKLSERYQTAENIRATRLLFPLVVAYLLASLLAGGILLFGLYNYDKTSPRAFRLRYRAVFQSFDLITAFYAAMFPYLAMYGHSSLLTAMKSTIFGAKDPVNRDPESIPLSMDGRRLVVPPRREAEIHFAHLDAIWNRPT
ncbi:unnamed protein product, partial [Mesorhabditis spiculigera]